MMQKENRNQGKLAPEGVSELFQGEGIIMLLQSLLVYLCRFVALRNPIATGFLISGWGVVTGMISILMCNFFSSGSRGLVVVDHRLHCKGRP